MAVKYLQRDLLGAENKPIVNALQIGKTRRILGMIHTTHLKQWFWLGHIHRVKCALRWFSGLRPVSRNTPWSSSGHDLVTITQLLSWKHLLGKSSTLNICLWPWILLLLFKWKNSNTEFYTCSHSVKPVEKVKKYLIILLVNISLKSFCLKCIIILHGV